MCGIAGWVDLGRDLTRELPTLRVMTDAAARRGVDDQGLWTSRCAGLGHTRTAIIDPAGGAQPLIVDADGRPLAVIVYNGEVYNSNTNKNKHHKKHKQKRNQQNNKPHNNTPQPDRHLFGSEPKALLANPLI